jgi:hypothetical protein
MYPGCYTSVFETELYKRYIVIYFFFIWKLFTITGLYSGTIFVENGCKMAGDVNIKGFNS